MPSTTTIYNETNINVYANEKYTIRAEIPEIEDTLNYDYGDISLSISDNDGNLNAISINYYDISDYPYYSEIKIGNNTLSYNCFISFNDQTEKYIFNFEYEWIPEPSIRLENNIIIKKDDDMQKIQIPIIAMSGTNNISLIELYNYNPNTSNLVSGGIYYNIEKSS